MDQFENGIQSRRKPSEHPSRGGRIGAIAGQALGGASLSVLAVVVLVKIAGAEAPDVCKPYAASATQDLINKIGMSDDKVVKFTWNKFYTKCINSETVPELPKTWQEGMAIASDVVVPTFTSNDATHSDDVTHIFKPKVASATPPPPPTVSTKPDQRVCTNAGMKTIYLSNGHSWRCRK